MGVAEVKGSVNFVENVHRCRFELEEGEDKREGYKGSIVCVSFESLYFLKGKIDSRGKE